MSAIANASIRLARPSTAPAAPPSMEQLAVEVARLEGALRLLAEQTAGRLAALEEAFCEHCAQEAGGAAGGRARREGGRRAGPAQAEILSAATDRGARVSTTRAEVRP
jgi:hypothetical protein